MSYTYWLVKQKHDSRIYSWVHENYPGINFWIDRVVIPSSFYEANTIDSAYQNFYLAIVVWFEDLNDPDLNVKFKLMNADIILDHKHEKPDHVW